MLADEFGEFAMVATFFKFAICAACEGGALVLLYELPCCLRINFGEFATFVIFVKFALFTTCKGDYFVLFYILPHCLLTNWANMPRLPHLSNLSYSLPAKAFLLADEFDKFCQICCCVCLWRYLNYIIWHLYTLFISFCYVLFAEDVIDA